MNDGKKTIYLSSGRILRSILALPFVATVALPLLLWAWLPPAASWEQEFPLNLLLVAPAVLLIAFGLSLIAWTIRLFSRVGRGTLAPWDRTEVLVVQGPYRYVRNPMISGVFFILLGESSLLLSPAIFAWFLVFVIGNLIYIPKVEEARLEQQYGQAYRVYRKSVPAWIPRRSAWEGREATGISKPGGSETL